MTINADDFFFIMGMITGGLLVSDLFWWALIPIGLSLFTALTR